MRHGLAEVGHTVKDPRQLLPAVAAPSCCQLQAAAASLLLDVGRLPAPAVEQQLRLDVAACRRNVPADRAQLVVSDRREILKETENER